MLDRAHRPLSIIWWALIILRALLTPGTAIATGVLVGAVEGGDDLTVPLAVVGALYFV